MMFRRAVILIALASVCAAGAAQADSCRRVDDRDAGRKPPHPVECRAEDRLQPYEPGAVRAGSSPGFVDLGNGSEVRVGGRVRMDYDVRR